MIKTHKPRGYHWTNVSAFQQTEGYRSIDIDECQSPPEKAHSASTDESLSAAEQDLKKKRIEKLAQDFLDGQPLRILSARPAPSAVRDTVVWNQKSSNEPKFVWNQASRSQSDAVWEDVEDEDEVLRRITRSRRHGQANAAEREDSEHLNDSLDDMIIEERAEASCEQPTRTRSVRLAALPSEEALRLAAALRDRALRRLQFEKDTSAGNGEGRIEEHYEETHASEQPDHNLPPSTWLSRHSPHTFGLDFDEQSLDELRLSRMETPSRQLKRLQKSRPGSSGQHVSITQSSEVDGPNRTIQDTSTIFAVNTSSAMPMSTTSTEDHRVRPSNMATRGTGASHTYSTSVNDEPRVDLATPIPVTFQPVSSDQIRAHNSPRAYTAEQGRSNNITPFMFRKRGSACDKPRHRSKEASRQQDPGNLVAATTPIVHSSPLQRTSDTDSLQPSDLNRRASEPPITAEDECDSLVGSGQDTSILVKHAEPSQFWPGTQVLLHQAQEQLFTSPEKKPRGSKSGAEAHSMRSSETTPVQPTPRKPLKQLSQEPLPSTQALMEDFAGFSTVKKPRTAYVGSDLPTPTGLKRADDWKAKRISPADSSLVDTTKPRSVEEARRSSRLRFGVSADSPTVSPDLRSRLSNRDSSFARSTGNAAAPQDGRADAQIDLVREAVLRPSARSSQADDSLPTNPLLLHQRSTSSQSFTSAPEISSFQCAQKPLFEGESFQEITAEVLGLGDMEGILSQ